MAKPYVAEVNGKELYRRELEARPDVPLWQQPWWLDATAGDKWDALCLCTGERLVAALPYVEKRRAGMTAWVQPQLTQSLGPWLLTEQSTYERRLSRETLLLEHLASCIPKSVVYRQNWQITRTNWLPFYWAGYRQTTSYTYRLDLTQPEDSLNAAQSKTTRWTVKTARDRFGITAAVEPSIDALIHLNKATFKRQGATVPYSRSLVQRIFTAGLERGVAEAWIARDATDGQAAAGALIVRDASTAYYLLGGADPSLRATGAQNLLTWEAIKGQMGRSAAFDFEGSMIRPIERSFRSYGAIQVPYFAVSGARKPVPSLISLGLEWKISRRKSAQMNHQASSNG